MSDSEDANVKAISLLSGGLDSILATRVVQDQGVDVLALHFITPFFGDDKRGREEQVVARCRETYGIRLRIVDVSDEYLEILADPQHGYGRNFNPCVDCKIFFIRKATEIMHAEGARFLITGEVLGQRPMSQRRDAMNTISKQTGVRDILLRPLSAKLLPITAPERHHWVHRDRLYGFSGRNRKPQIELAASLGITEYPTPAGGCSLTDPNRAVRVRHYFDITPAEQRRADDVRMLLVGRPFRFPGGGLLTLSRTEAETAVVLKLLRPGDEVVRTAGVPGPVGVFRPGSDPEGDRALAARVVLRYCSKAGGDASVAFGPSLEEVALELPAAAATDSDLEPWRL